MTLPPPPRSKHGFAVLALIVGLTAPGCHLGERIEPQPIPIASSVDRTAGAIRDALRRNGWEIESSAPGLIVAHCLYEDLPVKVRIAFDDEEAEILWDEDSDSLGDDDEEIERHRKTIRRLLRGLAERVEYFVESADLGS